MSSHLNPSQQHAVDYDGGHLLIIAGPGTGKTHTLTHRIAAQVSRLKDHQKILAVTFTQHAAKEMRERLRKFVCHPSGSWDQASCEGMLLKDTGSSIKAFEDDSRIFVGTFHAFCLQCLKDHTAQAGLSPQFRIASENDIDAIVKDLWPDLKSKERSDKLKVIGRLKSLSQTSADVEIYNQALRQKNYLDYDDLLLETVRLLESSADVRAKLQETYPLIFVDEYQDINPVQHQLLLKLVGKNSVLTAIGDPDQSIYGFRGSDVSLFFRFIKDFSGAYILRLTDNYRSTASLLKASGQVIAKNDDVARQELVAKFHAQGHLTIYESLTDRAEAEYVVHTIEQMVGGTSLFSRDSRRVAIDAKAERGFGDIAVLYRLNSQRYALQEALDRSGIPYAVSGDQRLIEKKPVAEFLDAIAALPSGDPPIADKLAFLKTSVAWHKLFEKHPEWLKNVDQLIRISRDFATVEDLRHHLALQKPEESVEYQVDKVQLMTLHAAKGLEFPVVFITGCEQGLIPLLREGEDNVAEERRLFYVGMTRAKEELILTHAHKRFMYGQMKFPDASPFLQDIADDLKRIEAAQVLPQLKPKKDSGQMSLFQ